MTEQAPRVNLAHWWRMSPLLDELLDLPAEQRPARLAQLRAQDAALADTLRMMLARLGVLQEQGFLDQPVLGRPAATPPPPPPPPGPRAGQRLGAYVLDSLLGEGGMGQVWLARRADGRYDEEVAVKLMRTGLPGADAVARFRREAQILARLDHPAIVRLRDAGVTAEDTGAGGHPYLVLDLVRGRRIDLHCEAHGLDMRGRVRLMIDVLDAVGHAHQRGVLHRDLKPANILVTDQGRVRLLDFGIAKLVHDPATGDDTATAITRQAGPYTERYAAPEQVQGGEVTTATDVYAAGVLLYELLTGAHPTDDDPHSTPLQRMDALVHRTPAPLAVAAARAADPLVRRRARELRGDLATIVAHALRKPPAERYPQAAALADDLRRWLAHDPISAQRDSTGDRLLRMLRRHRVPVLAATGAGVLALAAGAGLALWQASQARAERVRAEALVAQMLADLKGRLEPAGRLDLMAGSSRRALAYYLAADPAGLDGQALSRRSDALRLIGEMARIGFDLPFAQDSFEQAVRTSGLALRAHPGEPQRLREHAENLMLLAKLHDLRSAFGTGLVHARDAVAHARAAAQRLPADVPLRLLLLETRHYEAYLLVQMGRPDEALAILAETEPQVRTLLQTAAAARGPLGGLLQLRGQAHLLRGDLDAAAASYAECAAVLAQWQAQSGALDANVWEKRRHATALRELARVELERGRTAAAQRAAREAAGAFTPADFKDAGDAPLLEDIVRDRLVLARAEWAEGMAGQAAAAAALDEVDALAARMPALHADRVGWHARIRGELLTTRARVRPGAADDTAELRAYVDGLARFETGDRLLSAPTQLVAAGTQALLAQRLQGAGRAAEARLQWQQVLRRLQVLDGLSRGGPPSARALRERAAQALKGA